MGDQYEEVIIQEFEDRKMLHPDKTLLELKVDCANFLEFEYSYDFNYAMSVLNTYTNADNN